MQGDPEHDHVPNDGSAGAPDGPQGPDGPPVRERRAFTLDRFLKYEGLAETGGQAKMLVREGCVTVNGEEESRVRRQLSSGDVVACDGEERIVP